MIPLLLQIGPQCTDSALSLILQFMSGPYLQSYAGQEAKLKKVEVDEFQLELWCRSALTRTYWSDFSHPGGFIEKSCWGSLTASILWLFVTTGTEVTGLMYRAPELLLKSTSYAQAVGNFFINLTIVLYVAVGAILAEVYRCIPLFPGDRLILCLQLVVLVELKLVVLVFVLEAD
ncbi:hypothetical protein FCM35_KLT20771 [Carex littledalei]|uniref:Uncharacterized protein n=1 Tax=Carex littledalei TaxID=544730 RepID=A0A833VCN3_9POAL|nr:hypothetical protein FCM35_KLT20771 [Carex littledalei]